MNDGKTLHSGDMSAKLLIGAQQPWVVRPDIVSIPPFSSHLQLLRLGRKGFRPNGQRCTFQRMNLDRVIRPIGAFKQGGKLRLLLPALRVEKPQHLPVKALFPTAII